MPYKSEQIERFLSLSLGISNCRTLYDAFDDYVKGEKMDGDNKYYCEKYDTKIEVMNRSSITSLPKILLITLKRFGYDQKTYQRRKLNDYFEFPLEIDMKRWTKEWIDLKKEEEGVLEENFCGDENGTTGSEFGDENLEMLDEEGMVESGVKIIEEKVIVDSEETTGPIGLVSGIFRQSGVDDPRPTGLKGLKGEAFNISNHSSIKEEGIG
jgi:hypothetical protein